MRDITARVVAVIQHELRRTRFPSLVPTVTAETDLLADLRCCAVDYQCIAMELDEEFGIVIPDRFVEEGSPDLWRTPADFARSVRGLLSLSPTKDPVQ